MGCGCKNDSGVSIVDTTIETKKFSLKKTLSFLFLNKKFSIGGFLLFLVITPLTLVIALPFVFVVIFNQLVLSKNTDLVKFITFTKDKKTKK